MSSLDVADLNDYRLALGMMADERLVLELISAHELLLNSGLGDEEREVARLQFDAAKTQVLRRMDYEKGVKK